MENIQTLLAAVAQTHGFDDDPVVASPPPVKVESSEPRPLRVPPIEDVSGNAQAQPSAAPDVPSIGAISAVGQMSAVGLKRKRGRPPKGPQTALAVVKPPSPKREKLEEDVCFICFDGGSLVLCDRKGCPKAYHPSCVKRDEAFFQSKAKWNCGWHICTVCRKSSHYMCYTCPFSLCKRCVKNTGYLCTKNTDYLCVRGTKGFCGTCLKMVMLIENKDEANNEEVKVDFDDKTSWEYLFKVYWVLLKEKLSLTLPEITQASPPMKVEPGNIDYKPQLNNSLPATVVNGDTCTSSMKTEHLELNTPCAQSSSLQNGRLRTKRGGRNDYRDAVVLNMDNSSNEVGIKMGTTKPNAHKVIHEPIKNTSRAVTTVDHDGAAKPNSHKVIDDPIKKDGPMTKGHDKPRAVEGNNVLRAKELDKTAMKNHSEWASKDLMEFVAFFRNGDKSAMSPFDAQKLLLNYIKKNNLRDPRQKSHIVCDQRLKILFGKPRVGHIEMLKLLEFHFPAIDESQNKSLIPAGFITSDVKINGNGYANNLPISTNRRKRKVRKKTEARTPLNNLNDYAAIDARNINLIFLRRYLMEVLLDDQENFRSKVIGSMVRIRTASKEQKQDVYRLVQVVGIIRVAEFYKIGEKMTNVMLEVLNLYKKEVVSIDAISNQEFTEDECRRLRQSIRCGLVKQITIGEVQKIALALQPTRINDWLESEILRLTHLRDRASENGRKKELREYVERLEVLKSPEDKHRRLSEVPEIHTDPKMSPYYESDEDGYATKSDSKVKKVTHSKSSHSGFSQNGRNLSFVKNGKKESCAHTQNKPKEKLDVGGAHRSQKLVNITKLEVNGKNTNQPTQRTMRNSSANNIETEKTWHYRDPQGKIQGPFSMVELRIWNRTGLFPLDMRIWTNHEQHDSVLLTDALIQSLPGASEMSNKQSLVSTENGVVAGIDECDKQDSIKVKSTDSSSSSQCWNLLNDDKSGVENVVKEFNLQKVVVALPALALQAQKREIDCSIENVDKENSNNGSEIQDECCNENQQSQHNEETLRSANIKLDPKIVENEAIATSIENSGSLDVDPGLHFKESKAIVDPIANSRSTDIDLGSNFVESRVVAPNEDSRPLDNDLSLTIVEPGTAVEPTVDAKSLDIDLQTIGMESKALESIAHVRSLDIDFDTTIVESEANVAQMVDTRSLDTDVGSNFVEFEANAVRIADLEPSCVDLDSMLVESKAVGAPVVNTSKVNEKVRSIDIYCLDSPTPVNVENQQLVLDNLELMSSTPNTKSEDQPSVSGFMEDSMSPMPRSNIDDAIAAKQPEILDFANSGSRWIGSCNVELSDAANEWCGFAPTLPEKPSIPSLPEWDSSLASVTTSISDGHQISEPPMLNTSNWMEMVNEEGEMIVIDALGEEYLSNMLAEVDASESQVMMPSPDSEFRMFLEDNDCFSSIEDFNHTPIACDASGSTSDVQITPQSYPMCDASCTTGNNQMTSQSSCNPIEMFDTFDSFRKSSVNSSASNEDAHSEFHPLNNPRGQGLAGPSLITTNTASGSASASNGFDPGWGNIQGNINLVTVHGNVNLVLGGPGHGMTNIDWGTNNPVMGWAGPSLNESLLPWVNGPQQQCKYGNGNGGSGVERWPGEMGGFGRGRLPQRGRPQAYGGGGGYARPVMPKRVCKFYGSGRCKKGAFCDYLHQ